MELKLQRVCRSHAGLSSNTNSDPRSRKPILWKASIKLPEQTGFPPKLPVANNVNGFFRASDSYV